MNYNDPNYISDEIVNIIRILMSRMSPESIRKNIPNIKNKIDNFNQLEMSNKKNPSSSAIGTSISIMKNILNGKDVFFIRQVLDMVKQKL